MATEDQVFMAKRGVGRMAMSHAITLTMAAGATVNDSSFTPVTGSRVKRITWHTTTSFTGTPTNINLAIGKTAGAQDYVANVDVKTAAAPTAAALGASGDYDSWPNGQALYLSLTAVGGVSPAGSCVVIIEYDPPTP